MNRNIWRVVLIVGLLALLVTVRAAESLDASAGLESNLPQGTEVDAGSTLIRAGEADDLDAPTTVESNQAVMDAAEPAERPAVETVTDTRSPEERDAILNGVNLAPPILESDQAPAGPYPGTESVPGGEQNP